MPEYLELTAVTLPVLSSRSKVYSLLRNGGHVLATHYGDRALLVSDSGDLYVSTLSREQCLEVERVVRRIRIDQGTRMGILASEFRAQIHILRTS